MTATLRNFSNITPPADVLVRFFLGYPASGNQIAACTIAKAQLARSEGPASCDVTWEVSGASGEEKIYAMIDPGSAQKPVGAFDEMHDEGDMINNNIGYGLLHVANADYVDPGLRRVQAYQPIIYEEAPGSGYGLYVPTTNFTETIRYELVPIDLGSLSIVGVPIQVQAFRGGQQFPEENHSISPIPAGLMVTYNDTDLLPGMVESDLRLYRLDGSTWVDATCPGDEFYRFANDNALVVPICQTGIFVLSDQEPVLLQTETFLPFVRK
jgi:hypothetical protein